MLQLVNRDAMHGVCIGSHRPADRRARIVMVMKREGGEGGRKGIWLCGRRREKRERQTMRHPFAPAISRHSIECTYLSPRMLVTYNFFLGTPCSVLVPPAARLCAGSGDKLGERTCS